MVVHHGLSNFNGVDESVLTVGIFDGIHLGHRRIIKKLVKDAELLNTISCLITFDPHPQNILRLDEQPNKKLLSTIKKKIQILEKLGLGVMLILPFNENTAKISAIDFLRDIIIEKFHPKEVILGHDHHFGYQREGNSSFMSTQSNVFNFKLEVIGPVESNGKIISSTYIRDRINNYSITEANNLLSRNYEISGRIIHGQHFGRELGFPTANIELDDLAQLLPPDGVYCVDIIIDNNKYCGMCYIGSRPTFGDNLQLAIEVNILNSEIENIYDEFAIIEFKEFVRAEIKFDSKNMLINQLKKDREKCLN
ncbi:MAG: bifunctional riboflavin kinase/FAD synthetase [Candidatus Marinimicrobia bacterium]|nr:bifunctional riboflavin kinase/FAD synthetase [Candidatus Neomarinimicrobiota bacterium]MBT3634414.1 bifunctional riboflavin kinase/FAD synthetase [Candidatus Neomarinimicrobiota bacterium]MBT3683241.1 bifunctional riboflavin kinase/FAD synthetase [Candidatus Neomarinimicrobiota bacterium]MBT3760129.1 bifunctional riboflavin kinase/FAD synthetase [Candidatus Neomarinimicrobiota bacterium]MBT3896224.1 bifunctional riboflavin kinase/FAD synthetase [Candidatus Neomarinimicrobiota bacterium]